MKLKLRCLNGCGKEEMLELPGQGMQSWTYIHGFCEEHEQIKIKCTTHHSKKKTIEKIESGTQTVWTVDALCEDCFDEVMNATEEHV